ncbi:polysaccharide biosynthesis/export family protein [Botrimarina colliarenosi]|uniref:polysaccharide biosynthesis/export family protein n=1 Tax=Botrimarina colliarenosi TaxID=2528001 RepID=UPI0018D46427|nr:polysaccharide biosynthesis/export family protein [Botrimarina colliarenosi]
MCLALLLPLGSTGCQYKKPFSADPGPAIAYRLPPRELRKTSLPPYIIEPPDVLTIDAVSLVPVSPYLLRPLDVVQVSATGLPEELPLPGDGRFQVGMDGTLVLGGGYDMVTQGDARVYSPLHVAGMPLPAVRDAVQKRLEQIARKPDVWMTLAQIAPQQGVAGEHLVAPDGTINLGAYGQVRVVGLTLSEAKAAVESQLSTRFERPEVAIDVYGYNSKVYYVVTQGAGLGDQIVPFPVTGNETALDAISQVQGLTGSSSTRMWIARPGKNSCGGDQILPVDWLSITQRGDTTTNYQLLPGDRMFIAEDKLVAFDTGIAKLISPVERVLGVTLLGTQTAKQIRFFNNPNARSGGF